MLRLIRAGDWKSNTTFTNNQVWVENLWILIHATSSWHNPLHLSVVVRGKWWFLLYSWSSSIACLMFHLQKNIENNHLTHFHYLLIDQKTIFNVMSSRDQDSTTMWCGFKERIMYLYPKGLHFCIWGLIWIIPIACWW